MPATKLKEFLDTNKIKYSVLTHSTAYTAQEIASLAHIRGQELAKTVMVKVDGRMAMAVLPASRQVDLSLLKSFARARTASLAIEADFRDLFPGCETGAMPPFGNLYDIPVFVDESLSKDKEIAFNAGTHNELIRLSYADFARLVQPRVFGFAAMAA
ncbi:MAG TPA: YbaK/EbsC family protein [Bryobacteraceae bacterium]|nr:YbaK/EbsC family protein [Bryobacteraceae bacterium]